MASRLGITGKKKQDRNVILQPLTDHEDTHGSLAENETLVTALKTECQTYMNEHPDECVENRGESWECCVITGCEKHAQVKGLCKKHNGGGQYGKCDECKLQATGPDGKCDKHGGRARYCVHVDENGVRCTKQLISGQYSGQYCVGHGKLHGEEREYPKCKKCQTETANRKHGLCNQCNKLVDAAAEAPSEESIKVDPNAESFSFKF